MNGVLNELGASMQAHRQGLHQGTSGTRTRRGRRGRTHSAGAHVAGSGSGIVGQFSGVVSRWTGCGQQHYGIGNGMWPYYCPASLESLNFSGRMHCLQHREEVMAHQRSHLTSTHSSRPGFQPKSWAQTRFLFVFPVATTLVVLLPHALAHYYNHAHKRPHSRTHTHTL